MSRHVIRLPTAHLLGFHYQAPNESGSVFSKFILVGRYRKQHYPRILLVDTLVEMMLSLTNSADKKIVDDSICNLQSQHCHIWKGSIGSILKSLNLSWLFVEKELNKNAFWMLGLIANAHDETRKILKAYLRKANEKLKLRKY